jgi:hypothetical protein
VASEDLEDQSEPFLPVLPVWQLQVGMVGVSPYPWFVTEVTGENELVATFQYISDFSQFPLKSENGSYYLRFAVSRPFQIRGFGTKGLVIDAHLDLEDKVLLVKDTTDVGGVTTFVLEVVDPVVVSAFEEAVKQGPAPERQP